MMSTPPAYLISLWSHNRMVVVVVVVVGGGHWTPIPRNNQAKCRARTCIRKLLRREPLVKSTVETRAITYCAFASMRMRMVPFKNLALNPKRK